MRRGGFERLEVYQLAERLADQIWAISEKWPVRAWDTVGRQLVRSADSVGANLAEGTGRGSYVDNRRFVLMARGSFEETRHWLRRSYRRGWLQEADQVSLSERVRELGPRLNAYLKSIPKSNSAPSASTATNNK